jgi:outer membrane biosynthesis protein TonB
VSVERLHELWTKYLAEGVLLPEEEQELVLAFRQDPKLAEQLLGDVEIDGLLRALPEKKEEAEAVARRFLDCVSAESDADRFVSQIVTRLKSEGPRGVQSSTRRATRRATVRKAPASARFPWRELAVAAGVLIGIGILYAILSPSPAPPRRAPEIVRPPEPRETPAPETRDPAPPVEKVEPREPQAVPAPLPAPSRPDDPVPSPAPKPPTVPVRPAEKVDPATPRTITTVAALEKIEGEVFVVTAAGRVAAKAGDGVPAGEALETAVAGSSAVVRFADGTRLELGADTLVREISDRQANPARGRRVMVARGSLTAEIPRQPADQPMTFATPHGEARVLGTSLRLDVGKVTRLEVKEGRVRFTRSDGKKVDVAPGQFAVAGAGTELAAKPLAQERRILYQWDFDGPNPGAEWERGSIERTQTFGGSRGALKALYKPDADYAVHAGLGYMAKPFPVAVTERTSITFSYFISAPVEIKLQMRADRTKPTRMNIGYIIQAPKANAWTTVTVRFTEAFRTRVGLDDLIKPGITELDDIQFHASLGDKPVDLFIDNVAIFE